MSRTTSSGSGSLAPRPKVAAAGIAGTVTTVLIWILHNLARVDVTPEVAAALATVIAFAAGYFTPQSPA